MLASVYDPLGLAADVYARANHTGEQAIATITGLQAALDGKAASTHTHALADINQAALDAKADVSHTHTIGQVST
jgi:Phage tail repeat like